MRDASLLRRADHRGGGRVEAQLPLGGIKVPFLRFGSSLEYPVDVVKDQADVAEAADAGFRADGRDADLDPGEAERALLRLAGPVVEIHLLVRAAGHAHPPAAAAVLVDQDDAVLRSEEHTS